MYKMNCLNLNKILNREENVNLIKECSQLFSENTNNLSVKRVYIFMVVLVQEKQSLLQIF